MPLVRLLYAGLQRLSTAMALVAGTGVLFLAVLITVDVLMREYFGWSVQGTDELGGYVLALVASMGFSYVLFERGFTRIDLVVRHLPPRVANVLHVVAYVMLAATAVFLGEKALATYLDTLQFETHSSSPLQTPMWIPQGFWLFGMLTFALCSVLQAIRAIVLFFVAPDRLQLEFGVDQVEDELAELTHGAIGRPATASAEVAQ